MEAGSLKGYVRTRQQAIRAEYGRLDEERVREVVPDEYPEIERVLALAEGLPSDIHVV